MSTRKFAAIVVATLTLGTTILTGGPANADDSTATTASARAAAQRPDVRPGPAGVRNSAVAKKQALSAAQLAKRDEFANRTGLAARDLYGPYHIINQHSNKCLTIYTASTANNANAVQYTCDFSYPFNEEWYLEDVYGDQTAWHLRNAHSGKCLTIYTASTANNATAVQYTCDYSSPYNEEWYMEDVYLTGARWHLRNGHSFKCLTIYTASTANNYAAVQYTCDWNSPFNEEWRFQLV
ncbi:ricin-type beta-trefoil lectin protein [Micromonospora kangleipakensis]|uniref:Ricin-type beta-trefoil lectin protein n=1 Tax=Micromonospora kangleipakensis TaxID=1077942 RepID=A0A4V2GD80_9ACTN|nr:RICIN domain-containing protein [Micromonospora kangleipakensis]RZU74916.1 ricin-type beta-trefoil lectin protein [Micromonospora kangleipakensis]